MFNSKMLFDLRCRGKDAKLGLSQNDWMSIPPTKVKLAILGGGFNFK